MSAILGQILLATMDGPYRMLLSRVIYDYGSVTFDGYTWQTLIHSFDGSGTNSIDGVVTELFQYDYQYPAGGWWYAGTSMSGNGSYSPIIYIKPAATPFRVASIADLTDNEWMMSEPIPWEMQWDPSVAIDTFLWDGNSVVDMYQADWIAFDPFPTYHFTPDLVYFG